MSDISLIMPCYNRAYDLKNVLESYDKQVLDENFEIIAIDDCSSDDTLRVLTSYKPKRYSLRIETFTENQGPAFARNRGIKLVKSPVVMFVGDDILPDQFLVKGHLAAHRRYPKKNIAVLGRVIWPPDMPINTLMKHIDGIGAQQFSYYYFQDEQEYDFRHFYTANISLKSDFLKSIEKKFDTEFTYAAFEDVELAYRLSKNNLKILYQSILIGYHYHYHNIWTFSERQYKAGLMASLLIKKHPELTFRIIGLHWYKLIINHLLLKPISNKNNDIRPTLEIEILQRLSEFEWTPYPSQENHYLQTLNYFFYKGFIFGRLGETPIANKICNNYAQKILTPILTQFKEKQ